MRNIEKVLDKVLQFTFRFLLFISSYIPLFIIIFLKNITDIHISIVIISIFIVIPLLVIRKYISNPLRHEANKPMIVLSVDRKEGEILNYISAYIIPLIAFNTDVVTEKGISVPNLLGVIILFSVICNLYMKAGMYYVNPILNIFYDIYAITTDKNEPIILIADKGLNLPLNKTILTRRISPGIYLRTDKRKNKISYWVILIFLITLLILLYTWNGDFQKVIDSTIDYVRNLVR